MHLNSKESIFTPVWSPGISYNPKLSWVIYTPTNNRHYMVDSCITRIWYNSTSICYQICISTYSASDRSIFEYFLFHIICTNYLPKVWGLNHFGVRSYETIFAPGPRRSHAIFANELARTGGIAWVGGKVSLAGVMRDALFIRKLLHVHRLPAVATVIRT